MNNNGTIFILIIIIIRSQRSLVAEPEMKSKSSKPIVFFPLYLDANPVFAVISFY